MATTHAAECPLTGREYEAVTLMMQGLDIGASAARMGITESAVRSLLKTARQRLGLIGAGNGPMFASMFSHGWVTPQQVAPHDTYSTWLQATKNDLDWRPSAAQRCYLNAFNRLLWRRDPRAAVAASLALALMCLEAGVRPPTARPTCDPATSLLHLDDMLMRVARGVTRPIPVD